MSEAGSAGPAPVAGRSTDDFQRTGVDQAPLVDHPPVTDWETDFDHTVAEWAQNAQEIWAEFRQGCPVAHTERFGGCWFPSLYADVSEIAHDTENFSSRNIVVNDIGPFGQAPVGFAPPITSDPPFHKIARKLLLGPFAPKAVAALEPATRELCRSLIREMLAGAGPDGVVDAATDYAQHIPVRVIARMLGLPETDGERFRAFIHRILEKPGQVAVAPGETLSAYLQEVIQERIAEPRDDLISYLAHADIDGEPLTPDHVFGSIALLLIAGIDTTWSAIGASLWHLAQNPDHYARLRTEPEVWPFAVEEFLRFYAPVTMARVVQQPVEVGGAAMAPDDWVLLAFPSANRDEAAFDDAGEFVIDRQRNRHAAFGLGIHRCVGSNLARMELRVALQEWTAAVGAFELADYDPASVRWSTGQVRGPRELPVHIIEATAPESAANSDTEADTESTRPEGQ
ncbi:MAG: cytochrome P450 [Microthrixaceae bacterium]